MKRWLLLFLAAPLAAQNTGFIVVDPDYPEWLYWHNEGPAFIAGVGDPEGWLHLGTKQADGTRSGGSQSTDITAMSNSGANGMYVQIVRSHGGDGAADENPFIDNDPANGLDADTLAQWDGWFTSLCAADVVVFLFFYDDAARIWNTGDTVGAAEQTFLEGIVNEFEDQSCIVWVWAEEYSEKYTTTRVQNGVTIIRAADDYNHPVGVHQLKGLSWDFKSTNLDIFLVQNKCGIARSDCNTKMNTAWTDIAGDGNLVYAESHRDVPPNHWTDGTERRELAWAVAMGGAYTLLHEMTPGSTTSHLEDHGRVVTFFEQTAFNTMAPDNSRISGDTDFVLANHPSGYILYADAGTGQLGVTGVVAGTYDLLWFDPVDGDQVSQTDQELTTGTNSFTRPGSIGAEAALWITEDVPVGQLKSVDGGSVSGGGIN